jgi:hippurate hydrolase
MPRADELKERIDGDIGRLAAIRQDLHAHPEIGLEEVRTSEIIARELGRLGYAVHRGLAKTGVVGTLRLGTSRKTVGIRADIDALPIIEATGLGYASTTPAKMHACGHDGHTTMLLGAARQIAERKVFDGTIHVIFQPAEENWGGARIMMDEGLFRLFPCDAVFAAHNEPGRPVGEFGFREGPLMAAIDQVQITVTGKGGHGAAPEETVDPVVAGAALVMSLQTIVSRNVSPHAPAVVTVGCLRSGEVCNVIPETAFLDIGIRYFDDGVGALLRRRIDQCADGVARGFGARAEGKWVPGYPVTVNEPLCTRFAKDVAAGVLGQSAVEDIDKPYLGSEDFAFMLRERPGSYFMMGNGVDCAPLHNSAYNFNDDAIPHGVAYWTTLTESFLKVA